MATTINTSNELADMREKADKEGRKIGDEAFEYINVYMTQFINHLEKINDGVYGGKKLNIDMDNVRHDIEELKNTVKNYIGDKINTRLVKTDPELALILEERNDTKRKSRFDEFYAKVHRDAVRSLIDDIQDIIAGEFVIVEKQIRSRITEVNESMQQAQKEYEEAGKLMEQEGNKIADKKTTYMYQIAVADLLSDELKRE
ncbi:hypothetical protein [Mitsuokella jalaludinii]|uniref:hypothetical protein n=1 Tax=Mitsuokella jalaludinii TaxID=187979 RepID=UPI00055CA562|nr:hypothetical protein [Mitsuokella jalaludinii]